MASSLKLSQSTLMKPCTCVRHRSVRTARSVVRVQASISRPSIQPPKGVTLPPVVPEVPPPKNGFVDYAERINSRAAMLGFFALLAVEAITGKGLLESVGLTIGKGLGFEL